MTTTLHIHKCTHSLLYHMTTIDIQHGCRTYYVQQHCPNVHTVFRSHHYSTSVLLMFNLIFTCEKFPGTEPNRLWGFFRDSEFFTLRGVHMVITMWVVFRYVINNSSISTNAYKLFDTLVPQRNRNFRRKFFTID